MYARAAKMAGEEYPRCIDDVTQALDELIPFLAKQVRQPKDGRRPDGRRHLCAAVCAAIWEELYGHEPYSEKLWEAYELYWQACDHPETSPVKSRFRNWERYLLQLSHP
jgi:hypothetical protein